MGRKLQRVCSQSGIVETVRYSYWGEEKSFGEVFIVLTRSSFPTRVWI